MQHDPTQPVRIISLQRAMEILAEKLGPGGEIRISVEPEGVTEEMLSKNQGDKLWSLAARSTPDGKQTVGELSRVDKGFFRVQMVFHNTFSIWHPYVDQEFGNEVGPAGYRFIGAMVLPVTNLGGVDFILTEQTIDPLGVGWTTVKAASASNVRKVLEAGDKRIPGAVRFDPHRISSVGGVEQYVRWVDPDKARLHDGGLMSVQAFVDQCQDNRALGVAAKAFTLGPLRKPYQPKTAA